MSTIKIKDLLIKADFDKLSKEIKQKYPIKHDIYTDEEYEENFEEENSFYKQSISNWNESTTLFEEGLEDLEKNFEEILQNKLIFTKKNRFALNQRQILLTGDHILNYSNKNGFHEYENPIIEIILLKDKEAILVLSVISQQDPF